MTFIMSIQGEQAVRPIRLVGEGEIVRVERNAANATFSIAIKCKDPVSQLDSYLPA